MDREYSKKHIKKQFSYGYTGWITFNNQKVYCRSKQEFIFYKHFEKHYLESDKIYEFEKNVFYCDGVVYKPDLVIKNQQEKIIRIIEIKDVKPKENSKYYMFKEYFNKLNIQYDIFYSNKKLLNNNEDIKKQLNEWIEENKQQKSMSGEQNPMWGIKQTEVTKKLIGLKATERMKNDEYRQQIANKNKLAWKNPDTHFKYIEAFKERGEKVHQQHLIIRKCIVCGKEISCIPSDTKKCCSNECVIIYSNQQRSKTYTPEKYKISAIKNMQVRLINYGVKIVEKYKIDYNNIFSYIKLAKSEGVIPLNFGISEKTVIKYFNNLKQYYYELEKNRGN